MYLIRELVWRYRWCGYSADMKAPDGLALQGARWIVAGTIRLQPQYPLRTSPRSCVTVARNLSSVISSELVTLNVQALCRLARASSAWLEPIRPDQVRQGSFDFPHIVC